MKDYTIKRSAGLWSTAEGYEVRTTRRGLSGSSHYHCYHVHSASMRRFYRLSKNDINIFSPKAVDWLVYRAM